MMHKRWRGWAAVVAGCVWVSCWVAAEPIRVMLDFQLNANHLPLVIAEERGLFEAAGLDVELLVPTSASDPAKLAAAGIVEIALTPQTNYMIARDAGLPVVAIGALIGFPLGGLLALEDHGIAALADLAGGKIGYSLEPLEPILWRTMLAAAGVDPTTVDLVHVGMNTVAALLTEQVDAIGAFRNVETFHVANYGFESVFFPQETYGVPQTMEVMFIAGDRVLADRSDALRRFFAAISDAIAWMETFPEEAEALFFEANPELDTDVEHHSLVATLPLFAADMRLGGEQSWRELETYLADHGLIGPRVDEEAWFTERFLPNAEP
ncbi:ABC transporter substrate-binding protein [Candidatus Bipolaricaulota bacterium]|nr:ABC transporter substrate-binding protein [Candidatus Bipolaricaulota bacterium]